MELKDLRAEAGGSENGVTAIRSGPYGVGRGFQGPSHLWSAFAII